MTFNLLDEPWIQVRRRSGETGLVSIRAAFTDAAEIRAIAGELPTQDVAILRLLIAIMLRAAPHLRKAQAEDTWAGWWQTKTLPETLPPYLEQWQDRFDLLDPVQPFYQVPDLATASGKTSGLNKLIAEVPDGHQFFTVRTMATSLTLAEAARWLVHCMAFDCSGIKSGAIGDDNVKAGKGFPIGRGWAGSCAVLTAEGDSLLETLLLNLVLTATGPDDAPLWEREPLTAARLPGHTPRGAADILTWPSRRIRLFVRDGMVTDALVCNGDPLDSKNQFAEPFTIWRYSKPQSTKLRTTVFMPAILTPGRSVWRGLEGLLAVQPDSGRGAEQRASALLEWLAGHVEAETLLPQQQLRLRVNGLAYGSQDATVVGSINDTVTAEIVAFTNPDFAQLAVRGASTAEEVARAIGGLGRNLAWAAGADPDAISAAGEQAREAAYARFDRPFREWLLRFNPRADRTKLATDWQNELRNLALAYGKTLTDQAGPAALTGREVDGKQINVPIAWRWFYKALKQAVPLTTSHTTKESQ